MVIKKNLGDRIFDFFNALGMIMLMVVTMYPILYVFFASISNSTLLMGHTGLLTKPLGFSLEAYELVFKNPMIGRGYLNTLFIVIIGVSVNIIMTSIGAYFLSRKNVFWKKFIMLMIVFTMFFNGGLIPMYLVIKGVGLNNNLWGLIIPFAMSTFNLIIMCTAFMSIPDSMEESAKIDGANDYVVLFRIILPLSLPIIAVMILYYGVDKWNAWFYASVIIKKRSLFPLQIILREILLQNSTDSMMTGVGDVDRAHVGETIKYATIIVATLPILCVYPFLQKYFVKGVMIGAVKE